MNIQADLDFHRRRITEETTIGPVHLSLEPGRGLRQNTEIEYQGVPLRLTQTVALRYPERNGVIVLRFLFRDEIEFGGVPLSGLPVDLCRHKLHTRLAECDQRGAPRIFFQTGYREKTAIHCRERGSGRRFQCRLDRVHIQELLEKEIPSELLMYAVAEQEIFQQRQLLRKSGVMGIGKYYLTSPKFISADGGFKRIVWMSSVLKQTMAAELQAVVEREGDPDLISKIADETICTDVDGLLAHLESTGHPALMMDPMF